MSEPKKSFTSRRPPVPFDVDGEEFTVVGSVPAEVMKTLLAQAGSLAEASTLEAKYDSIRAIVATVMLPESLARFAPRLSDMANPVDIDALAEISTWLVSEVYSRRPTASPSPSTTSGSNGGTSSTGGPPPAVSIPSTLIGTATSTSSTGG